MEKQVTRCINIDWLEVYCLEASIGYPHDAEYFRRDGWHVVEREYGTPTYKEMFTLYSAEDDLPLIEVRRAPKSPRSANGKGVLDPYSCHIRLSNRTCYMEDAAGIMQQFLERYMFEYSRISRIDICLDFEKFDTGDDPNKFLQRYISGRYSKINQARIAANGLDQWDGRYWNSVRWGNEVSMVSTKFYDKTMELKERHDKPYIRQAWWAAGLVEDWYTLERHDAAGTVYKPRIWRVEFSIKSSERNWFVVEDPYKTKRKLRSIRHTLDQYHTRRQLLDVFFSLADHYFHFKHYEKDKRKDRCQDKVLWRNNTPTVFYKITHVATSEPSRKPIDRLLAMLYDYREQCCDNNVYKACNVIIEKLEFRARSHDLTYGAPLSELQLLRQVISRRVAGSTNTLNQDIEIVKALMQLEGGLFGETKNKN